MKKLLISFLIILSALSLSFGVGCSNEEEPPKDPLEGVYLTLDKTDLTMTLGDTATVGAEISKTQDFTLEWTSSDQTVAKVSDGIIEALSMGDAKITAKYTNGTDYIEKTVNVIVRDGDKIAVLSLNEDDGVWRLPINAEYPLNPTVTFNGKVFNNGVTLTAKDYDQTILTVENNVVKTKKLGKTTITLDASYGGMTASQAQPLLTLKIEIEVFEDCQIYVNGEGVMDVELFTVAEFEEQQFATKMPFELKVIRNGALSQTAPSVSIEKPEIAEVINGELIAKSYGKTNVTLSWEEDGFTEQKTFEVKVNCPSIDDVIEFDVASGTLDLSGIAHLSGKNIVSIRKEGVYEGNLYASNKLNLEQTDVKIKADRSDVENLPIVVELANSEFYRLPNFKPYTKIFSQSNKDEIVSTFVTNTAKTHDGYYLLSSNISSISFERTGVSIYGTRTVEKMDVFKGVFDGRGYAIENLTVKGAGLFGDFGDGATVKNVAFVMDFGKPSWHTYGLFFLPIEEKANAILENVYINVKEIAEVAINGNQTNLCYSSPIAYCMSGYAAKFCEISVSWTIKNVITEMPVSTSVSYNASWTGSFTATGWFDKSTVSNAYAISRINKAGNNSYFTDGIKQYADKSAMKSANNNYTDFANSGYWTVATGEIPVWKSINA